GLNKRMGERHCITFGPQLGDATKELHELRRAEQRIGDRRVLDECFLRQLGAKIAAVLKMLGADDRKGNVLLHSCSLLGFDQILSRGLEEIHGRLVLEGRRVRQIDDDLRTFERFGKALACDCVDAGIGRCCESLMPKLRQLAHDLRTDESGSSDYYDLHDFAFRISTYVPIERQMSSSLLHRAQGPSTHL